MPTERTKTRLTERDATADYYPAWSPDGLSIAFASSEGHSPKTDRWALFIVDVRSKRVIPLFSAARGPSSRLAVKRNTDEDFYLFSVDLEDVAVRDAGRPSLRGRVPDMARRYMSWLKKKEFSARSSSSATWPRLIPASSARSPTRATKSAATRSRHIPLERQNAKNSKRTSRRTSKPCAAPGSSDRPDFGPRCSPLPRRRPGLYGVLREIGFRIFELGPPGEKSVLRAGRNSGRDPRSVAEGIWELPMTVARFGPLAVPSGGRRLFARPAPKFFIMRADGQKLPAGRPLLGYCHPYDIDTEQERFMHPDIDDSRFYNFLMYLQPGSVFRRLDAIIEQRIPDHSAIRNSLRP